MLFILGVSITLNAFIILASIIIFKFKKNGLKILKNDDPIDKNLGINKEAIVDYKSASLFLK